MSDVYCWCAQLARVTVVTLTPLAFTPPAFMPLTFTGARTFSPVHTFSLTLWYTLAT
jgi:hypothetical protein